MEEKTRPITIGQRYRRHRKRIVYIVKGVKDDTVLLVSEDGEDVMRIHQDSVATSGFEPVYD